MALVKWKWGYGWVGLISCVVVVDPEITFGLERERDPTVLGKGVVHLCVACVHRENPIMGSYVDLSVLCVCGVEETYMIEEPDSGRDFDDLLG